LSEIIVVLELQNGVNKPFGGIHLPILYFAHNLTAVADFTAKLALV
jgi:hypothetical protein